MSIDFEFYTSREIRKIFINLLEETSAENLVAVPEHFNNNIWWNIAHVAVTQQLLLYKLSGLALHLPDEIIKKYAKGSRPEAHPSAEEIALIKSALIDLVDKAEQDYHDGVFKTYNEYTTSANVCLRAVEDAISFNNFHEGIHLGSILALKRALAAV